MTKLIGTAGNDVLTSDNTDSALAGLSGDDTLTSGNGNDILSGGMGTDTLTSGAGDDQLDGGAGADKMTGGAGNDTYYVDDAKDQVIELAGGGSDRIIATASSYVLAANIELLTMVNAGTVTVTGNSEDNYIDASETGGAKVDGGAGKDHIFGGTGSDSLSGGDGNDGISGGGGDDTLNGGNGDDVITGAAGSKDILNGDAGNDKLFAEGGTGTLNGGAGDDILHTNGGTAALNGGDGSDQLFSDSGDTAMAGGAGDDTYYVTTLNDTVSETAANGGTDTVNSSVNFILGANLENLTLTGSATTGTGNALNNVITASDAGDTLDGKDGNDTLIGGKGVDDMTGGAGNDIFYVDGDIGGPDDVVHEDVGGGIDKVVCSAFVYVLADNVENMDIMQGSSEADGNKLDNIITIYDTGGGTTDAGAGNDKITGNVGTDFVFGNTGNDTIDGGGGLDILYGGTGADVINGGDGTDLLYSNDDPQNPDNAIDKLSGGAGDDFYNVDGVNDVVIEAANGGDDTVFYLGTDKYTLAVNVENLELDGTGGTSGVGNAGDNELYGTRGSATTLDGAAGNDEIWGGAGKDSLKGGAGDDIIYANKTKTANATAQDTLDGGAGNDTLYDNGDQATLIGGAGDDVFNVDNAQTTVSELANGGTDTVFTTVDNYTLGSTVENLVLAGGSTHGTGNALNNIVTGAAGDDTLAGGDGNDTLYGNKGADTLNGGTGDDTLDGGLGIDAMTGGIGNDTYYVDDAGDTVTENVGEGTDTIISSVDFNLSSKGVNVENLILAAGPDDLNGTGNALANSLTGNDGDNKLDGGAGIAPDKLVGGAGDDIYVVHDAKDQVVEAVNGGNDRVWLLASSYVMAANVENLTVQTPGGAAVTGNVLANTIDGGIDADTLTGGGGNDILSGNNSGNTATVGAIDSLDGGAGDDTLKDNGDQAKMTGGAGNDAFYVDNAATTISEAANGGTDTVYTTINNFVLAANVENLILDDSVDPGNGMAATGNAGDNVITGTLGSDDLVGGAGNDTLKGGGGGVDILTGGAGNDTYYVYTSNTAVNEDAKGGNDTVYSYADTTYLGGNIETLILMAGSAAVSAYGDDNDNVITGNDADNSLDGGVGNDTLNGGAGKDTLIGGDGNDTLNGGAGDDMLNAGNGTDTLNGGDGDDVMYNNGSGGATKMTGGAGNDTYYVDSAKDQVIESVNGGNDTVYAQITSTYTMAANVETLYLLSVGSAAAAAIGNTLDNKIDASAGAVAAVIDGGAGNDTITGSLGSDTLKGGDGNDTIDGNGAGASGTDTLYGGNGNDTLKSSGLTGDKVYGEAGDDTLLSLNGHATLTGGVGNDIYHILGPDDVVVEALNGGTDTVYSKLDGYVLAANVENLTLEGTADSGTGNTLNNILTGVANDDDLHGFAGDDTLIGNGGDDTLDGGDGNDVLNGGAGDDTMTGGLGNDTYYVDSLADVVTENVNEGTDKIVSDVQFDLSQYGANVENLTLTSLAGAGTSSGNQFDNVITGNDAGNELDGEQGNDTLVGGASGDTLDGGSGDDTMTGKAGDDTYYVDSLNDKVIEAVNGGHDTVETVLQTYTLAANVEDLYLNNNTDDVLSATGNALDNYINAFTAKSAIIDGGAGNDQIDGSISGVNNLKGGDGNDELIGGSAKDILNGGNGDDILVGNNGADTLIGGAGNDTYKIDFVGTTITEGVNGGIDLVESSIAFDLTTIANVENLTLMHFATQGTGNSLNNIITANDHAATLDGKEGNDQLIGGAGNDTLTGGIGDDILTGGGGKDKMTGGLGNDTYYVDNAGDQVIEAIGEGTDTVVSAITFTLATNVENLTLAMGKGNINATGNDLVNTLLGNDGNNKLDGGAGDDKMTGGLGNDTYIVDSAKDQVIEAAGGGIDEVQTALTSYTLAANVENLTLTNFTDSVTATGNALGNLVDATSTIAANIDGGAGDDVIWGSITGTNILKGGDGNDELDGGLGTNTLIGGNGNDIYVVFNAADTITELANGGTDTVQAYVNFDLSNIANVENIVVKDGGGLSVSGNSLNNTVTGNDGDDTLDGKAGDDVLIGGLGADTLTGGAGNDLFVYALDNAGQISQLGDDTITDFEIGKDKIDVHDLLVDFGINQAFAFDFDYVSLDTSGPNTIVSFSTDGDPGNAVTLATVTGVKLTTADITL